MSPALANRKLLGSRDVALQVVRDVFADHPRGAREALDYRLKAAELDARDRAFATELAYGAIKMRRYLDYQLAPYLGDRATTIPKPIAEILRLGTYQLRVMSGVEAYAAVSESVGLARKYGHKGTAGLVNAVLRKISSEPERATDGDGDDALAVRFSLPTWIVIHWRARFGSEALTQILAGVNAPAGIGLSIDLRRTKREIALAALHDAGMLAAASPFVADAIVLQSGTSTSDLDKLSGGRWELHAEAACMPVDLLDPQPGQVVFEACSGRGNKTMQLASRIGATGRIEAVELDERKVAKLKERLATAEIDTVTLHVADASVAAGRADCDRVLVDAPCSGLGIIGRQPEARWRKSPEDGARLAPLQAAILEASAVRLTVGGTLVYAVCSTDAREGEEIVDAFLVAHPHFARVPAPERYASFATAVGDLRVIPGIAGRDGFYLARVTRTA